MTHVCDELDDDRFRFEIKETVYADGRPYPCMIRLMWTNHFRGLSTDAVLMVREWCQENLPPESWRVVSLTEIAFQPEVFLLFKLRWS